MGIVLSMIQASSSHTPPLTMSSEIPHDYLCSLSDLEPLVDDVETYLNVFVSFSIENYCLILYDKDTTVEVARVPISDCPKKDLLKVASDWCLKMRIYKIERGLIKPIGEN